METYTEKRMKALEEDNLRLRKKLLNMKLDIGYKDDVLHRKNLALDALGYVWCSGGCKGGVLRYDNTLELTEQQVNMVETNTIRLRQWFEASKCRRAREDGQPIDKCGLCTSQQQCFPGMKT